MLEEEFVLPFKGGKMWRITRWWWLLSWCSWWWWCFLDVLCDGSWSTNRYFRWAFFFPSLPSFEGYFQMWNDDQPQCEQSYKKEHSSAAPTHWEQKWIKCKHEVGWWGKWMRMISLVVLLLPETIVKKTRRNIYYEGKWWWW